MDTKITSSCKRPHHSSGSMLLAGLPSRTMLRGLLMHFGAMAAEAWGRTCPSVVSAWDRQRMRGWGSSMSSQLLRPTATAQQPELHVSIGPFAPGRLQSAEPESPQRRARRAVHPGCSHQQGSSVDRFRNVLTCGVLAGVIQEGLARQPYRFRVVGQFPVW